MRVAAPPAATRTPAGKEVAAVACLALLTVVATPGTRGVLGDDRTLVPVTLAALAVHAVVWAVRRRWPAAALAAGLAAGGVLTAWIAFPGTTTLGIPLASTWRAAGTAIRLALEAMGTGLGAAAGESVAAGEGRLALAVLLVAICALTADQAAFRMGRPLFALVPSLTLVLLGATRAPVLHPGPRVAVWLIVAAAFLAAGQAAMPGAPLAGIRSARPPWPAAVGAPAALMATVAVTAALAVGPRVPGYDAAPVVSGIGTGSDAVPARLRALVDLGGTLTERSDDVMFTVSSVAPEYWRLTSLDVFDGRRWSQSEEEAFAGSPGSLPYVPGTTLLQEFEIGALRSEWLPAAYQPQGIDGDAGNGVAGGSGTIRAAGESRFGQRYQVYSYVRNLSAALLQGPSRVPNDDLEGYRALPAGLPPSIMDEAVRIVGDARFSGGYRMALALQEHFRSRFTYDLNTGAGRGDDALARFLFRTRRGFCEQFAGAFAVLARAVGLPARVAVGFTPGDLEPDGRYHVRGRHAHAWPEVFLGGAGWVAFEPTPGRGIPQAEAYTGVAAAQAQPDGEAAGTPTTAPAAIPALTTPTSGAAPPSPTPSTAPVPTTGPPVTSAPPAAGAGRGGGGSPGAPAVAVVTAGLAVASAGVMLGKRRRRSARRRRAPAPGDRVLLAWAEAAEALAASGMPRRPSETMLDHAARVAADDRLPGDLAEPVRVLAGRAGLVSYGGRMADAQDVEEASAAAALVEARLRQATPVLRRVTRATDPRPLWRRTAP